LWSGVTPGEAARELSVVDRAGADTVRVDVGWSTLELTGKGRFDLRYARRLDAFVREARGRGINVILTLVGTPCWASSAPASLRQGCRGAWWLRGVDRYPPRRAGDYADAASYVARRWGRDVLAFEVWNEPNTTASFRASDPVRSYASLLRATYRPVKRAAPRLTVLGGALLRSDGDFLTALYERGRIAGYYDAISYHPYAGGDPGRLADEGGAELSYPDGTAWLHDIAIAHGDATGDLWATEAGASSCVNPGVSGCVSELAQASAVAGYLRVGRAFPYLHAVVIYNLRDKGTDARNPENRYGIVRSDLRPKPAFRAFRREAKAG
jgi:hypothetical protein